MNVRAPQSDISLKLKNAPTEVSAKKRKLRVAKPIYTAVINIPINGVAFFNNSQNWYAQIKHIYTKQNTFHHCTIKLV